MHIIVLGCGRVGAEIALQLDAAGHDVAVVDRNKESFRRLTDRFTGRAVLGTAIDKEVLEQAGIDHADAVAAVMYGDNSNIVAARIARETYQVPSVVARIKDPRRAEIYQRLGIPTVATVTWTTDQVLRRLSPNHTTTDWTSSSGSLHLVEHDLPASWAGHRLDPLLSAEGYRLVAISRAGEARLAAAGVVGQEGDILHLMVHSDGADALERALEQGGANR